MLLVKYAGNWQPSKESLGITRTQSGHGHQPDYPWPSIALASQPAFAIRSRKALMWPAFSFSLYFILLSSLYAHLSPLIFLNQSPLCRHCKTTTTFLLLLFTAATRPHSTHKTLCFSFTAPPMAAAAELFFLLRTYSLVGPQTVAAFLFYGIEFTNKWKHFQ